MHKIIHDDENLEPWVEEKIAVAAYMMDSVGHYLQYEKHVAHEEGEGEEGHVDFGDEMGDEEMELDADELGGEEYDDEDEYGEEEEDEELAYEGHVAKGDPSKYITDDGKSTKRGLWANVHLKKQRQERSKG